jgi:hypothetical protein
MTGGERFLRTRVRHLDSFRQHPQELIIGLFAAEGSLSGGRLDARVTSSPTMPSGMPILNYDLFLWLGHWCVCVRDLSLDVPHPNSTLPLSMYRELPQHILGGWVAHVLSTSLGFHIKFGKICPKRGPHRLKHREGER